MREIQGDKIMKKHNLIKIIVSVALAVLMLAFTGCFAPQAKTFKKAGMSIVLTEEFYEKDHIAMTAYYESSTVLVVATKEEFSLLPGLGDYSLTDYANVIIVGNQMGSNTVITEKDNYVAFQYSETVGGKNYSYWATCFKTDDAFWLIQFACETKNFESKMSTFEKYANSVTFYTEEVA
jgi:hypothetical protein